MLEQTEGLNEVPCVNGRKLALIEQDEYEDVNRALDRWQDRRFTEQPGFGPIWRNHW